MWDSAICDPLFFMIYGGERVGEPNHTTARKPGPLPFIQYSLSHSQPFLKPAYVLMLIADISVFFSSSAMHIYQHRLCQHLIRSTSNIIYNPLLCVLYLIHFSIESLLLLPIIFTFQNIHYSCFNVIFEDNQFLRCLPSRDDLLILNTRTLCN